MFRFTARFIILHTVFFFNNGFRYKIVYNYPNHLLTFPLSHFSTLIRHIGEELDANQTYFGFCII